jgi:hypothetical protein
MYLPFDNTGLNHKDSTLAPALRASASAGESRINKGKCSVAKTWNVSLRGGVLPPKHLPACVEIASSGIVRPPRNDTYPFIMIAT